MLAKTQAAASVNRAGRLPYCRCCRRFRYIWYVRYQDTGNGTRALSCVQERPPMRPRYGAVRPGEAMTYSRYYWSTLALGHAQHTSTSYQWVAVKQGFRSD